MLGIFFPININFIGSPFRNSPADQSPEAFDQLKKYALEAYRLTSPSLSVRVVGTDTATIKDGETERHIKKDDRLLLECWVDMDQLSC
jgi:hypothetical protein